jgi:hypothetical protein
MNFTDTYSFSSRHSQKGILAVIKLAFICSVTATLIAGSSKASMTILSQQCHVSGHYTVQLPGQPGDSYDLTGWKFADGSVSYDNGINASSSASLFTVSANSSAFSHDSEGQHIFGTAEAMAEGYWLFTPQADSHQFDMLINVSGLWAGDQVEVELKDITSGEQMYYFSGQPGHIPNWTEPFVQTFSFDMDHVYYMHAYINSTAGTDGPWSGSIALDVSGSGNIGVDVPEPAIILLLGLGAIMALKKR